MQVKGSGSDVIRVSVSSALSTSSHGSGQDDSDAVGDVYIWGEVICDNVVKVGPDRTTSSTTTRTNILVPRPLECNVVLDVHHVACGVRHAALVTRQGEVFTWGEASGGRLGHGVGRDVTQPRLVESLSFASVDFVACGEFHTCAVTMSGELYTWGDGTHNAGLLGHCNNVSHWIPKRISGPLEGLQVATVACGPWHTALITYAGQLFTFGDGTFAVLGHGDRKSVAYPREVESLSGLRTVAVACGVWHTAAVVEVIVTPNSASISSGKLFTWGDGDKYRLGHGDKESRLKPTCVPTLIDYSFHEVACGHTMTVGLTTSGQVFTVGSTVYGQLGNPQSDGKLPCLVEDKLSGESIEEIACGAYHVSVLTSKSEVYTWGRGANGRLGHGDIEDRKTPTLVEALKDRHVKYIACGSNYSAAICLHRWVSGTEQSQCSGCRQAFGFTRKRHNCYNCGLVHCHACSSRKAIRAAMAPDPSKLYRVCDSCFLKLSKLAEAGVNSRRSYAALLDSGENNDRADKVNMKLAKSAALSNLDLIKLLEIKAAKQGNKGDAFTVVHPSQSSIFPKPIQTTSSISSRSVSPFSRKSTPPRSVTPVPTTSGLSYSKSFGDSLKKANELLNQEVHKLHVQVESLKNRCELQDLEIRRSAKKAQEAMAIAAEESVKCKAAKEVIKSLSAQLKDMAVRLPPGAHDPENLKLVYLPNLLETNGARNFVANGEPNQRSDGINASSLESQNRITSIMSNGINGAPKLLEDAVRNDGDVTDTPEPGLIASNGTNSCTDDRLYNGSVDDKESRVNQVAENPMKCTSAVDFVNDGQIEAEWTEQYEPGVYITLIALKDGMRDLKRVRFSRRKFGERQAETWWVENRDRVYEKYNVCGSDKSSVGRGYAYRRSEGAHSPSSQI